MKLQHYWIAGFADGEGCFSFYIFNNKGIKSGFQIQGEFTVVQHKRSIQVLYALKDYFGCGVVAVNHGDRYHYRVKNNSHLLQIIIPFFEKYPLCTSKKFELPIFKQLCLVWEPGYCPAPTLYCKQHSCLQEEDIKNKKHLNPPRVVRSYKV